MCEPVVKEGRKVSLHSYRDIQLSIKVVEGRRSNRRWYSLCAFKFKDLLW
jgi:hypothetical protein